MAEPAFHEARFPTDIARGVVYGPGFKTTVVSMDSGYEQRNIDWSKIRSTGNIGTGLRKRDDSGSLTGYYTARTFFMERRGRAHGFRFRDWSDYQATTELLIASAVGGETSVQLVKTYGSVNPFVRTIYKPVSGTVQLFKNGSPTPLAGVTVDTATGIVTFPALTAGDSLRWTGEFDNAVRFDIDTWLLTLEMYDAGEVANIPIVELKFKPPTEEPEEPGENYPRDLTVINPGAESGTTGWTNEVGALARWLSAPLIHSGSASFTFAAGTAGRARQDIAIPAANQADVDAGILTARLLWWQNSWAVGNDEGEMILAFYDGSMVQIGSEFAAGLTNPTVWTQRILQPAIPANTRTIRIKMRGNRLAGSDLDAYFDDISLTLML